MVHSSGPKTTIGDEQAAVLDFLRRTGTFAPGEMAREVVTHAASIFLAGDRAWKLKRAVSFGYLDFSTSQLRGAALEAELCLNRRTAPDLYCAVHRLTQDRAGMLAIDGKGLVVDWLLEMRRFPDDALLDTMAQRGLLDTKILMRLADRITTFHATAEVVTGAGAARFQSVIDGNTISMAAFPAILDPAKIKRVGALLTETMTGLSFLLDARALSGRVRHAHGDLHLANIAVIDGEPTLFDCLEFSADLASIDVLYDLAFLLMDLWQRGLRTEANIVFNRYLDLNPSDESGIALLPLFLAVRATIRAHVLAAQCARPGSDPLLARRARGYLALAIDLLAPVTPRMVAVGGLSGTGKSTLSRMLGGYFGRAPGARILRSDVLRKRLAGITLEAPLPAASYSSASSAEVYDTLGQLALASLACGHAVVADAVFARRDERDAIAAVAANAKVAFDALWLKVPTEVLLGRLSARGPDASDADARVANIQSTMQIGDLGDWQVVLAAGSPDAVAAELLARLKL